MKKIFLILALLIVFMSCEKNNNCVSIPTVQNGICIDSTLINDSVICKEVYDSVCSCDGVTYSNSCHVHGAGLTSYVEGECCD